MLYKTVAMTTHWMLVFLVVFPVCPQCIYPILPESIREVWWRLLFSRYKTVLCHGGCLLRGTQLQLDYVRIGYSCNRGDRYVAIAASVVGCRLTGYYCSQIFSSSSNTYHLSLLVSSEQFIALVCLRAVCFDTGIKTHL